MQATTTREEVLLCWELENPPVVPMGVAGCDAGSGPQTARRLVRSGPGEETGSSSASLLHRVGRIYIDGDAGQGEVATISHCSSAIQLERACSVPDLDRVKCLQCVGLISVFSADRVRIAPIQLCRSGLAYRRSRGSYVLCSSAAMGRYVDLVWSLVLDLCSVFSISRFETVRGLCRWYRAGVVVISTQGMLPINLLSRFTGRHK